MLKANILGFLRMSAIREFKKIQAKYFKETETWSAAAPEALTKQEQNWEYQAVLVVNSIPSDDFSYYD